MDREETRTHRKSLSVILRGFFVCVYFLGSIYKKSDAFTCITSEEVPGGFEPPYMVLQTTD